MRKSKVVLAGAGKIGEAIVALLAQSGDYEVTVVEQDGERLRAFAREGLRTHACSLGEPGELVPVLEGQDGLGDFDAAYFAGPQDFARFFGFDGNNDMAKLDAFYRIAAQSHGALEPTRSSPENGAESRKADPK